MLSYLIIITVSLLVSLSVFEWRVWRRWHGRRLGLINVPAALVDASQGIANSLAAERTATSNNAAARSSEGEEFVKEVASLPNQISFTQAVEIRKGLDDRYRYWEAMDRPVPENVAAALKRAYFALTVEMQKAARRAGMMKEFQKAEDGDFYVSSILRGTSPEGIEGPLTNPISRPHIIATLNEYKHLGADPDGLLVLAKIANRLAVVIEPPLSPPRWIGGIAGIIVGWYFRGFWGAILGALSGQFVIPRLMGVPAILELVHGKGPSGWLDGAGESLRNK